VQLPETNQRMLEKAVTAISCVYLGKMSKDELILRRGTQLYNQAIRLLADRIQKNVFDDRFLYATVIFQMIEVMTIVKAFLISADGSWFPGNRLSAGY
jgi:hypothetical protein